MIEKKNIGSFGISGVFRGLGIFMIFGMLCLMGCSGEQHVVEPQPAEKPVEGDTTQTTTPGSSIAFQTNLPEHQAVTRSAPLENYATNFKVWGYKNMTYELEEYGSTQTVFPGYFVNWTANTAATTTSNSHDWEYVGQEQDDDHIQTIKFWDWSAKAYRFFAVAPSTTGTILPNTGEEEYFIIKLPADASTPAAEAATPYYSHLWFSDNTDEKLYGAPVTLEFIQPLAKVRFLITYPEPEEGVSPPIIENFDFRPEDENIHIAVKGEVTIKFPMEGTSTGERWTTNWVDESQSLLSMTRPYTNEDQYWQTVLPYIGPKGSGGQGTYVLKVMVNGEDKSCTVPENFMTWNPGYKYTYVFKVDAEGALKLDNVWVGVTTMEQPQSEYILYNW